MMDLNQLKAYSKDVVVLYAEDDEDTRIQFSLMLKNIFNNIIVAKDGKEAFELFKENGDIDLVITDITMPHINGIDLIHKIHSINPDMRCIVVSAHSDEKHLYDSINENINGYIYKPVNIKQLVNTLCNVCKSIRIEKERDRYKKQLENVVNMQEKQIKEKNRMLLEKAIYDDLTHLYSKAKFALDVDSKDDYIIIMFDIKNFSTINAAFGFDIGDELLKASANFLKQFSEYTYRIESNKFVMILWDKNIDDAIEFANKIYKESKAVKLDVGIYYPIELILSIGIAKGNINSRMSRKKAYAALRLAKEKNINIYVYNENYSFEETQKEIIKWVNKTKYAIDNDLIVPFFQPIYNLKTNTIDKFECLVRMIDKESVISPFKFLNAASKAGMLTKITEIVIDKSFAYFSNKSFDFSINITNEDIKNTDLEDYLLRKCNEYSIEPSRVYIEILENITDEDMGIFVEKVHNIKRHGFSLSVDDFGAENSNFGRLLKLNIDYIKIDGAFIKHIDTDINSKSIADTIVFYAKKTNKKTVAEFVHSKEVMDMVKKIGVDYAQGYYISEPVKDVDECLRR